MKMVELLMRSVIGWVVRKTVFMNFSFLKRVLIDSFQSRKFLRNVFEAFNNRNVNMI